MNVVMIIPTGIGCEIGGHAGDATPAAKLLAACCDKLILHPNVVNASDINEMPANALYVEGSLLDNFLEGTVRLQEIRQNKILVVTNDPVRPETVNAVSAARATIGADITIAVLKTPLIMIAMMDGAIASGEVHGYRELVTQVQEYSFDALAIATPIECEKEVALRYFRNGGVNPWGAVEAFASSKIAQAIRKPVAHAPVETHDEELKRFNEVVDPRMAAELVSTAFVHCVLKGLHKAPRIIPNGLAPYIGRPKGWVEKDLITQFDVDVLISPVGCIGPAHRYCLASGIPIIAVKENTCVLHDSMPQSFIFVENYLEAAGHLMAMRAGVMPGLVRRPLAKTEIRDISDG